MISFILGKLPGIVGNSARNEKCAANKKRRYRRALPHKGHKRDKRGNEKTESAKARDGGRVDFTKIVGAVDSSRDTAKRYGQRCDDIRGGEGDKRKQKIFGKQI